MVYRYGSHGAVQIEYHCVCVTKHRWNALTGQIAERVTEQVRETCDAFQIRIVKRIE